MKFIAAFSLYMNIVKNLKFEEDPDYGLLKSMFEKLLITRNTDKDDLDPWIKFEINQAVSTSYIQTQEHLKLSRNRFHLDDVSDQILDPLPAETSGSNIQSLLQTHQSEISRINKSHAKEIQLWNLERHDFIEELKQMKSYIQQIEKDLDEEKSNTKTLKHSTKKEFEDLNKQFDIELEQIRSVSEEQERIHVMSSQRREQLLIESIKDEQAKYAKLEDELQKFRIEVYTNTTKAMEENHILEEEEMPSDDIS
jgi:hypothetical protein